MKTAAQAAQNWTGSAGRAAADYQAGVQNSQKDQAALAVAAQARLVQNFNDAVSSGRWAQGVQRRGTAYWKSQTVKKAPNYSAGFSAGAENYQAAANKFMPAIANIVSSLPARGDINANIERVRALALALHAQKGNLSAG